MAFMETCVGYGSYEQRKWCINYLSIIIIVIYEDIFKLLLDFGEETSIITMREILGVNQSSPKNNMLKNILRQYTHLKKLCMFTCLLKIKIVDTNFKESIKINIKNICILSKTRKVVSIEVYFDIDIEMQT